MSLAQYFLIGMPTAFFAFGAYCAVTHERRNKE